MVTPRGGWRRWLRQVTGGQTKQSSTENKERGRQAIGEGASGSSGCRCCCAVVRVAWRGRFAAAGAWWWRWLGTPKIEEGERNNENSGWRGRRKGSAAAEVNGVVEYMAVAVVSGRRPAMLEWREAGDQLWHRERDRESEEGEVYVGCRARGGRSWMVRVIGLA